MLPQPRLLKLVFVFGLIAVFWFTFLNQWSGGPRQLAAPVISVSGRYFTDDYSDATGIQTQTNVIVGAGAVSPQLAGGGGEIDPGSSLGNGLVALWHLNGGALDAKGTNNGSLKGNTVCSVAGKFGQACSFDGDGDYVEVPYNNVFNISQNLSLSAWVFVNQFDAASGYNFISCLRAVQL